MRSRALRLIFLGALHASLFAVAPAVWAQTAADKATAREVATEGIQLYKAGKYAEALDRLRRAQALYDAPPHLLYIARSQMKLGQLVEAAENYRLLDHYSLTANAPGAFTAAVDDGRKELAALEPRIPSLRILSQPQTLNGPTLTIDGVPVSAAVIGIARPADPGKHHVELSAPGYAMGQADVELAEKDSKDVSVALTPQPTAVPPPPSASSSADAKSSDSSSSIGFLLGLRLGVGIPTGTIFHGVVGAGTADVGSSDVLGPGGGGELHFGVRFARYFTPVIYVEGESLNGKDGATLTGVSNGTSGAIGLGLIVGTPRNQIGGFGEFDVVFANAFSLTTNSLTKVGSNECKLTASGGALRFGGGAVFPVASWLHLTPMAMVTLGRFTNLNGDSGCNLVVAGDHDISDDDRRVHGMVLIGVGGDAVLGNDRR